MTNQRKDETTMKTMRRAALITAAGVALLPPAAASAHVTLQPPEAPAGAYTRLDVRVPNESDKAATNEIAVEMPDGIASASYEPVAGWTAKVVMEKLDQPLSTPHGEVNEQVKTITWSATGPGIEPGRFQDFGISAPMPQGEEGDALTFRAIQSYDDGMVQRWIGSPDSESPAPQVTLEDPEDEHHASGEEGDESTEAADGDDCDEEGAPTWLAVLGVVLGAGGLLAGGAALGRSRR